MAPVGSGGSGTAGKQVGVRCERVGGGSTNTSLRRRCVCALLVFLEMAVLDLEGHSHLPEKDTVNRLSSTQKSFRLRPDSLVFQEEQLLNRSDVMYLHIPKTGGTAMEKKLGDRDKDTAKDLLYSARSEMEQDQYVHWQDMHDCAGNGPLFHFTPEQMSRCKARSNPYAGKTVFCTVRNPVERLLSEMRWRMLQCSWDEPFVTEYIEQPFNVTCKTKDRIREGLKGKQLVEAIAYCKRKRIIRKRRDTKERKIGVVKILIQDTGSIKNTTCARLNRDMNAPERMAGRGFNFTSPYNFIGHEIEFVEAVSEFLSDLNQNETGTAKQDLDDGLVHLQPQAWYVFDSEGRQTCDKIILYEDWKYSDRVRRGAGTNKVVGHGSLEDGGDARRIRSKIRSIMQDAYAEDFRLYEQLLLLRAAAKKDGLVGQHRRN